MFLWNLKLEVSGVDKFDWGDLPRFWILLLLIPRAWNASTVRWMFWSNVTLSILSSARWACQFLRRRSWSIARVRVSSGSPRGLTTDEWKLPSGRPRGLKYRSWRVLRWPLLSGMAKDLAWIVAWNNAVQSHFSYDSWVGTLVEPAPPSLARKEFRTLSESSQISLGPYFSSHMAFKVLRKAMGKSPLTMDVNFKQFNCSFVNSPIFPSRRAPAATAGPRRLLYSEFL